MGMLVDKDNLGFGYRSWRYAMLVHDKEIVALWPEEGYRDNADTDPYGESSPQAILERIREMD
jgi:peroxiredoxin